MPRKKITIKKMEHNYQRTKTFSTRSTGLIKKAHDLSVLCDADVAAVMYSPAGNRKHFPTDKERMGRILERFLKDLASMPQEQRDQYKLSEATVDFLKTLAPVHHRADDSTTQPSQTMEVPSDSSNIVLALKEQASSLEPGMESIQELGKHRALLEHNLQNMMVAESQLPLGGREAGFEGPAQGSDEMPDQGANGKPQQRGNHRRPVQGGNSMLFDLNKEPASSV